jgi:TonB-linked SusC/RagA family outer membrane protein
LLLFLVTVASGVMAQSTIHLNGNVADETGESVIGASVVVKGSKVATITDYNGNFSLEVPLKCTLLVSYVGYITKEIAVTDLKPLNIVLQEDKKLLDEVVVVGYGTIRKADLAGSVSVMDNKSFKDQPVTRVSQTLQGRVSGVSVEDNGVPGGQIKIRVRGAASISRSNDPLYVIDGIVHESGLNGINTEDIQSIQVLKDASSTAIYGSRGSNGVILITTKTGHNNQHLITFDSSIGISNIYKQYKEMTPYEYALALEDVKGTKFSDEELQGYKNGTLGIDWQKEMFRTGYTQNYKVAVSNGNDRTQYYVSANYVNQTGNVVGFSEKHYQARANITSDATSWLHLTADVNLNHSDYHGNSYNLSYGNIIWNTLDYSPCMTMMDEKGNYNLDPYNSIVENPKGLVTLNNGNSMSDIMNGMLELRFKLLPGLTFTTTNGVDYYDGHGYSFESPRVTRRYSAAKAGNSNTWRMMLQTSNNLTYNGKWGNHTLTATGVWEASQSETRTLNGTVDQLPVEDVGWWNLGLAKNQYATNSYSKWALLSGVGRLLYNYADKYMLTATFRADGSSKFTNKKWGYFPSIGLAWNISNESFMKKQNIFSNMKLRGSYGLVGSQAINAYSTLALLSNANSAFGGTTQYIGYTLGNIATPDLTWEKTKQLDLGVDFSILNSKLDISIDYYNRKTIGALLQKSVPGYNGGGTYWNNVGSIRNYGIDLGITGHVFNQKDLSWNSTFNLTYLKNKVLDLGGVQFIDGWFRDMYPITRAIVGEPLGTFYGFKWAGINSQGQNTYYKISDGKPTGEPVTGDKITADDRIILGKSLPDVTLGWNNQLTWKNFDLNVFLTGSFGAKKMNYMRYTMSNGKFVTLRDAYYEGFDKVGIGAKYPSLKNNIKTFAESDQWLESVDYVRLQNITLGYNFDKKVTKFANIKIYASVQNLFTLTGYSGMDPASSAFGISGYEDIDSGIDYGAFPNPRTFTFGVKIDF